MPATLTPAGRRRRYARRRIILTATIAAVVGLAVLADRSGLFGRDDFARYDGETFRVTRVIDGDTLDIAAADDGEAHIRVRLWGIDTPETVHPDKPPQHFGPEASAFTRRLAADERVRLELEPHRTRGTHGRLLAYVVLPDGRMLNRVLVEGGYAYADPRYRHSRYDEFRRLQREAMTDRRGLWKDVAPDELPYYYRDTLRLPARPASAASGLPADGAGDGERDG